MSQFPRKTLAHIIVPGHVHALTFSCYHRLPLLTKDRTRKWFLESLERACHKHEYDCLAFVIMPEHVHLVVAPRGETYSISNFLQSVKQSVSLKAKKWLVENDPAGMKRMQLIDGKGRIVFRFWQQGGGYDRNIVSERYLLSMIQYIHDNPVRRNLVEEPSDWTWSSAGWYQNDGRGSIFDVSPQYRAQPSRLWR